ncbi:hypothetical protein ES703_57479 [subsurface metagenome]
MSRYKKYENLPWWLNNLNDNTLTPTQKEVLDLDYYCLKHGTKLSHEKAAEKLDRGRHTVYTARRRLSELILRTTRRSKGSFLIGNPIEYQNETDWLAVLRARGVHPGRFKMKRKSLRESPPLRGVSLSEVKKVASAEAAEAGVSFSQTPRGLTNRCSGEGGDSSPTQKARDKFIKRVIYRESLGNLLDLGYPGERAKRLARIKTDHYMAKRKAERDSR